jgi:hypothetical protein
MLALDRDPSPRAVRGFARIWLPLFVLTLGSVLRWRFGWTAAALVTWGAGAVLVMAALVSARTARGIFVTLTVATYPFAFVTSAMLLALVFFGVITPLGFWLRWRGHDPLRLRARGAASHWRHYEQDDHPERAVRQF